MRTNTLCRFTCKAYHVVSFPGRFRHKSGRGPVSTNCLKLLLSPFWVETLLIKVCGQHLRDSGCHTQSLGRFCVETRPVSTQTVFLLLLSPFWVETFEHKFGDNTCATYAAAPKSWKGFCVETRPVSTQTVFLLLLSPFWVETFKHEIWGQHLRNLRCRAQFLERFLC